MGDDHPQKSVPVTVNNIVHGIKKFMHTDFVHSKNLY